MPTLFFSFALFVFAFSAWELLGRVWRLLGRGYYAMLSYRMAYLIMRLYPPQLRSERYGNIALSLSMDIAGLFCDLGEMDRAVIFLLM